MVRIPFHSVVNPIAPGEPMDCNPTVTILCLIFLSLLLRHVSSWFPRCHRIYHERLTNFLKVAFTSYGEQSKRQRKLLHKAFGVSTIPSYQPLLQTETHSFLRRLIVDPAEYTKHIRRYAGGLTLSVVYGYEAVSNDDEFLSLAEECVSLLSNRIASGGGIWPVDIFPSLKHIPLWMPGSGFKKNAMAWKRRMEEFVDRPYEFVKNSIVSYLCCWRTYTFLTLSIALSLCPPSP